MSDPSHFLLKTENLEPVIEIINEFGCQIKLNQTVINTISNQIDNQLCEPNLQLNTDEADPIRHIIQRKYNLQDASSDVNLHPNSKINQLLYDNIQLTKLKRDSITRNKQLLQIIYDYESFILEHILPALRENIYQYQSTNYVDMKLNAVEKIYTRYSKNVQQLSKLIQVFSGIFDLLSQYDTFDKLLSQLEILSILLEPLQLMALNTKLKRPV